MLYMHVCIDVLYETVWNCMTTIDICVAFFQTIVSLWCRYDLYEVEVKCSKNISRSDGVFGAPNGYMYIELQMDEELFEGGRTVRYCLYMV